MLCPAARPPACAAGSALPPRSWPSAPWHSHQSLSPGGTRHVESRMPLSATGGDAAGLTSPRHRSSDQVVVGEPRSRPPQWGTGAGLPAPHQARPSAGSPQPSPSFHFGHKLWKISEEAAAGWVLDHRKGSGCPVPGALPTQLPQPLPAQPSALPLAMVI